MEMGRKGGLHFLIYLALLNAHKIIGEPGHAWNQE